MAFDPAALLAGPRGRRLLLECARGIGAEQNSAEGEEFLWALQHLEHVLEPSQGGGAVLSFSAARGSSSLPPSYSVQDFTRLLTGLALVPFSDRDLAHSLRDAVDAARYWQPPDGADVLAALPEVIEGLIRIAEQVCGSPFAASFPRTLDPTDQWSVLPADQGRKVPLSIRNEVTRWRASTVEEEERATRDRPVDPRAPYSGSWWSTPPSALVRSTGSWDGLGPVGLWLIEDSFGWTDLTASPVSARPTTVFEIDGPEAWIELTGRYPLEVTASRRHDWYRITGCTRRWVLPDWSRVAADLDAVHLTVAGYLSTAGRELALGDGFSTLLGGWDPDAAYWLTDDLDVGDPRAWRRDDLDWRPAD